MAQSIDKTKTVCFTGYRTSKILSTSKNTDAISSIKTRIEEAVYKLLEEGYVSFATGMADGFDLLAAEVMLKIKETHKNIQLIAVIPFKGQQYRYSDSNKQLYETILSNSDLVIYTSEYYHDRAFLDRNDFLLANSRAMICYYNGLRGGTMYTYNRALAQNHRIINTYQ